MGLSARRGKRQELKSVGETSTTSVRVNTPVTWVARVCEVPTAMEANTGIINYMLGD